MATTQGPIVPRRRIADTLKNLRDESGRTLDEVAEALLISTSKLSRLENAQGSPQARDVRDLIRFYGIENTQLADRLMRWVKASGRQGWWTDYSQTTATPGLDAHLAYETEATVARIYTIPLLPVLLQTPDYARAQYSTHEHWWPAEEVDRLVELRERRKDALAGRDGMDPLKLVAVTHESALRQFVGSREIMHAQLDHLVERSTAPNIELRVFPFTHPPLFSMSCMYAYFEFEDELDRDIVHIETHAGFRHIETAETVAFYRGYHDALVAASLEPDESRALIREIQAGLFG
ncbi:helix-turn-helix transcriptional regulator [Amycolatopsis sp. CA-128772]|uniref:helix-turn-helix domain-containing protein n=1 Tax=Amycolatopsis sp. CA-128772 TaxID=2073159 RepID=UPI000CD0BA33|nr:helix-turn-helix transcriptional regulator [Amycolatopsis sp. CA-128772]